MDGAYHRPGAPDLYPEALRAEIDEVNRRGLPRTSTTASTGAVSPARRRRTTQAYHRLFDRLDWLSERLGGQRYLVGDTITEADVRLFTTLVRFDAVYHGHFKCNRQKLDRDAGAVGLRPRPVPDARASATPIDFVHIKRHYYQVHTGINPGGSCRRARTCPAG